MIRRSFIPLQPIEKHPHVPYVCLLLQHTLCARRGHAEGDTGLDKGVLRPTVGETPQNCPDLSRTCRVDGLRRCLSPSLVTKKFRPQQESAQHKLRQHTSQRRQCAREGASLRLCHWTGTYHQNCTLSRLSSASTSPSHSPAPRRCSR